MTRKETMFAVCLAWEVNAEARDPKRVCLTAIWNRKRREEQDQENEAR